METQKYLELLKVSNTKFRRYTGATPYVLDISTLIIKEHMRMTKIKAGRHCNVSLEEHMSMLFEYYRENRTFFHLGISCGLSQKLCISDTCQVRRHN